MPDTYIKFDGVDGEAREIVKKFDLQVSTDSVELLQAFLDQPEADSFEFSALNRPEGKGGQPGDRLMFIKFDGVDGESRTIEEIAAAILESPDNDFGDLTIEVFGSALGTQFLKLASIRGESEDRSIDEGPAITELSDDFFI